MLIVLMLGIVCNERYVRPLSAEAVDTAGKIGIVPAYRLIAITSAVSW